MAKPSLVSLGSVIEKLFIKKESPFADIHFLFRLHQNWSALASEPIARQAFPAQFKDQELTLTLTDSSSIAEMHFFKDQLKHRINSQFPGQPVKKIILKTNRNQKPGALSKSASSHLY